MAIGQSRWLRDGAKRALAPLSQTIWRQRPLFLLGYMRCGSSLLSNILTSNPEIFGYGECHIKYSGSWSQGAVFAKVCARRRSLPPTGSYLFDKLLFNGYDNCDLFTTFPKSRIVILTRSLNEAADSFVRLASERKNDFPLSDIRAYYEDRLSGLEHFVNNITEPERVSYLDYQELLDSPEECLGRLSSFLKLKKPLTNQYEVKPWVGTMHIGDPSTQIKAGRILEKRKPTAAPEVVEVMRDLEARYRERRAEWSTAFGGGRVTN